MNEFEPCDKCNGTGVEVRNVSPPIKFREPSHAPVCTLNIKCDKCHGTGRKQTGEG